MAAQQFLLNQEIKNTLSGFYMFMHICLIYNVMFKLYYKVALFISDALLVFSVCSKICKTKQYKDDFQYSRKHKIV